MAESFQNRVERIKTLSRGHWPEIFERFGVPKAVLSKKNQPCPMCGGEDRFRFIDKEGSGNWFCRGCGGGDGLELLTRVVFQQFSKTLTAMEEYWLITTERPISKATSLTVPIEEKERLRKMMELWAQSVPIEKLSTTSPGKLYLEQRGLQEAQTFGRIREHPALEYWERSDEDEKKPILIGKFPSLLALVTDGQGQTLTLHRTFLTLEGEKATVSSPKKLMSGPSKQGIIRLGEPGKILGLAEGIETALSAQLMDKIPVWSLIHANGIKEMKEIPKSVQKVIIYGDNDSSYVGASAAYMLATELKRQGLEVEVKIPKVSGYDWNDVWKKIK